MNLNNVEVKVRWIYHNIFCKQENAEIIKLFLCNITVTLEKTDSAQRAKSLDINVSIYFKNKYSCQLLWRFTTCLFSYCNILTWFYCCYVRQLTKCRFLQIKTLSILFLPRAWISSSSDPSYLAPYLRYWEKISL